MDVVIVSLYNGEGKHRTFLKKKKLLKTELHKKTLQFSMKDRKNYSFTKSLKLMFAAS